MFWVPARGDACLWGLRFFLRFTLPNARAAPIVEIRGFSQEEPRTSIAEVALRPVALAKGADLAGRSILRQLLWRRCLLDCLDQLLVSTRLAKIVQVVSGGSELDATLPDEFLDPRVGDISLE